VTQLTGQDSITARALYNEHFEFTPKFKMLFSTNYLPKYVARMVLAVHLKVFADLLPPYKLNFHS
jgi:hypothetical protein